MKPALIMRGHGLINEMPLARPLKLIVAHILLLKDGIADSSKFMLMGCNNARNYAKALSLPHQRKVNVMFRRLKTISPSMNGFSIFMFIIVAKLKQYHMHLLSITL